MEIVGVRVGVAPWGRKRFLLPVTYFPTNLVYPFNLRVTGIINGMFNECFIYLNK